MGGAASAGAYASTETKPSGRASGRDRLLADAIRQRFAQKLGPHFSGDHAIKAVVTVRELDLISAAQRAATGGVHRLKADVVLVDAKTGQVLAAYRDQAAWKGAGSGAAGVAGGLLGGGPAGALGAILANAASEARNITANTLIEAYLDDYTGWLMRR